ncbi:MAG: molybdopterin converting factor subunit 1 [Pseudomonadota bacterium]
MNIDLRFFAGLREALGVSHLSLSVPVEVDTIGALRAHLRSRGDIWAIALADHQPLRTALNQQMTGADTLLADGCEIAFFPPVTGG